MGRLLIIIILLVTAVFATISLNINSRETPAPELVSTSLSHIKAKNISNEGLHYGIKQLVQNNVNVPQNGLTLSYNNFNVLDGTIDSIRYVKNAGGDTLTITCYASAVISGKTKHHSSTALVHYAVGSTGKAFNCSRTVSLKGNAEIIGGLQENANLNFQQTFGKTMAEMKALANYVYTNPKTSISPINGITYVELTGNKSLHMSGNWTGSGILIIDGNFKDTGNASFEGVIWVNGGSVMMSGNGKVTGAMFVETTKSVQLSGNAKVEYDHTVVTNLIGGGGGGGNPTLEILSWDN